MSPILEQRKAIAWRPAPLRLLVLAAAILLAGCTTTIVPPASPADPVTVFVLDHGRTPSLVLPVSRDRMMRYVYGDWNWYALRNTGVGDGLRALFWPTQGTLGRRELSGPARTETLRARIGADAITHIHGISVGRAEVERLLSRLDAEHRAGRQIAVVEALELEFVPHPQRYTYFHNSNHAVAGWLRDLGCEIHGLTFHSRWRVEPGARRD